MIRLPRVNVARVEIERERLVGSRPVTAQERRGNARYSKSIYLHRKWIVRMDGSLIGC